MLQSDRKQDRPPKRAIVKERQTLQKKDFKEKLKLKITRQIPERAAKKLNTTIPDQELDSIDQSEIPEM